MRCEEVKEQFAEYLAGTLDASVAKALEQHVASCPECQAEYAGIEALWQALGTLPTPLVPSNRMRERFSAMMADERAAADRRPASRQDRGRTWVPSFRSGEPLVQLALAASLLIVGVLVGRALPPRQAQPALPPSTEIAEVRSELKDMRQMLTLSLMQQQSATERLRGVSWTAQIDQPGNEVVSALLDTLLHDPNVNVRLAAIDALRRFSDGTGGAPGHETGGRRPDVAAAAGRGDRLHGRYPRSPGRSALPLIGAGRIARRVGARARAVGPRSARVMRSSS